MRILVYSIKEGVDGEMEQKVYVFDLTIDCFEIHRMRGFLICKK
jgi:hypothetical protein